MSDLLCSLRALVPADVDALLFNLDIDGSLFNLHVDEPADVFADSYIKDLLC